MHGAGLRALLPTEDPTLGDEVLLGRLPRVYRMFCLATTNDDASADADPAATELMQAALCRTFLPVGDALHLARLWRLLGVFLASLTTPAFALAASALAASAHAASALPASAVAAAAVASATIPAAAQPSATITTTAQPSAPKPAPAIAAASLATAALAATPVTTASEPAPALASAALATTPVSATAEPSPALSPSALTAAALAAAALAAATEPAATGTPAPVAAASLTPAHVRTWPRQNSTHVGPGKTRRRARPWPGSKCGCARTCRSTTARFPSLPAAPG